LNNIQTNNPRLFIQGGRRGTGQERPRGRWQAVEKVVSRGPFKKWEMQGSEKIQGAQCIAHT
jgi:hypothetical protein